MYKDELMPEVYKGRLHDDWPFWPFTRIPRVWTFYGFDMPPRQIYGNCKERFVRCQANYPLASDAVYVYIDNEKHVLAIDPVPPMPTESWKANWSLVNVSISGKRLPCYFTVSFTLKLSWGRWHFNIGLKPDITLKDAPNLENKGDWGWWFPEASFTRGKWIAPPTS